MTYSKLYFFYNIKKINTIKIETFNELNLFF